jgi:hypothetical protein
LPASGIGVGVAEDEIREGLSGCFVNSPGEDEAKHDLEVGLVGLDPQAGGQFGDDGRFADRMGKADVSAVSNRQPQVLAAVAGVGFLEGPLLSQAANTAIRLLEPPRGLGGLKGFAELSNAHGRDEESRGCRREPRQSPHSAKPQESRKRCHTSPVRKGNSEPVGSIDVTSACIRICEECPGQVW